MNERSSWMYLSSALRYVIGLYLLAGIHCVAALASNRCVLSTGLHEAVVRKYPAARLLTLTDLDQYDRNLFQKDHGSECPGLVRVDFYGDGKPTWALVLMMDRSQRRKAELIVAHQVCKVWEIRPLESTEGTPVVWPQSPGRYEDLDGRKTIRATAPVIVFTGYESWSILYAWNGKKVEKVQLSD
jgi:hypothetical protein